jgi:hypothetical protein
MSGMPWRSMVIRSSAHAEGEALVALGVEPPLRSTTGWTMPAPRMVTQPVFLHAGQPGPPQIRQLMSNATDGSVNG